MSSKHDPGDGPRKHRIRRHYEPRIDTARTHHEVLDWASEASQRARFDIFANRVDLRDKSLLDVGCGLGDLLTYLGARGVQVHYTGVDLLEKMVQAARRNHVGL